MGGIFLIMDAFHGSSAGSPYQPMPFAEQQGQGQMMAPGAMPSLPPFSFTPQAQTQDFFHAVASATTTAGP